MIAVAEDDDGDGGAAGQRVFDAARARVEAAEAERYAREGPMVDLPRFRKEDLQKQWERGIKSAQARKHNNWWISSEEAKAIGAWRRRNPEIVRANEQRMLDEYFGRVKKDGTVPSATGPDDATQRSS